MKDITKKYSNGEVTIVWKPDLCIHSAICFNGLSDVFHPKELPWITPEKSSTDKIIEQVKKCPSGALSYYLNRDGESKEVTVEAETIVETAPNGPLWCTAMWQLKTLTGLLPEKIMLPPFAGVVLRLINPFAMARIKR